VEKINWKALSFAAAFLLGTDEGADGKVNEQSCGCDVDHVVLEKDVSRWQKDICTETPQALCKVEGHEGEKYSHHFKPDDTRSMNNWPPDGLSETSCLAGSIFGGSGGVAGGGSGLLGDFASNWYGVGIRGLSSHFGYGGGGGFDLAGLFFGSLLQRMGHGLREDARGDAECPADAL